MIYPRKEAKSYGTKATIEGVFVEGEKVVLLDDLATTGGSKIEALEKLTENGLNVRDVVVLIDRESGAASEMEKAGLGFHAVFTLSTLLDYWEEAKRIPEEWIRQTRVFLKETSKD